MRRWIPESTAWRLMTGIPILILAVVVLDWLIVTDREAVERTLTSVIVAMDREKTAVIMERVHDEFRMKGGAGPGDEGESLDREQLSSELDELFSTYEITSIDVLEQTISVSDDRASVELSVSTFFKRAGRAGILKFVSDWELVLKRQKSGWHITSARRVE